MKTKTEVLEFLQAQPMWNLATCGNDYPNVIPLRYHNVMEDGKLITCVVFTSQSIENIRINNKVCISAFSIANGHPEGYKIYGTAEFHADGPYAEKAMEVCAPVAEEGFVPKGGAIVIAIDKITVASPGPDNNKVVE